MKAFSFGFNIFTIAGIAYSVSKYTKTRAVAGAIYRELVAAKLEQFVEIQKDAREQDSYIVCMVTPFTEGEVHPALEILRKHSKTNAVAKKEEMLADLATA